MKKKNRFKIGYKPILEPETGGDISVWRAGKRSYGNSIHMGRVAIYTESTELYLYFVIEDLQDCCIFPILSLYLDRDYRKHLITGEIENAGNCLRHVWDTEGATADQKMILSKCYKLITSTLRATAMISEIGKNDVVVNELNGQILFELAHIPQIKSGVLANAIQTVLKGK